MMHISDDRLDFFVEEDVPYLDLTCEVLGVGSQPGRMTFLTRDPGVVCCTEEAARICQRAGAEVVELKPSGTPIVAGDTLLMVEGPAAALHRAWKVSLNLLDHMSAVATKTAQFVSKVKTVNPDVEVLTTRKSQPGVKDLMTKAIRCGGAFPHRLGLSETVLVFDNHLEFIGGFDAFLEQVPQLKKRCIEKKLFVEVSANQALTAAKAGVDSLQIEKTDPAFLADLVEQLRDVNPNVTVIAAGGVNMGNCEAYAATGIDGIVTTCLFSAPPLDITAKMTSL